MKNTYGEYAVEADETANLRFESVLTWKHGNHIDVEQVRSSKNFYYERPYAVTGSIQLAGPEQKPKGIWYG